MIVVINPSGSSGYSFKGLNAYCSHDQGSAESAERVDWIDTRNLAVEDPEQAWKIMAATAQSQAALKAGAGIKNTGRKSDAHVQHIVLSYHEDEAQTPDDMKAAADELLKHLGVDPSKSRAKAKASQRQFADEHQAVLYAHSDTKNKHLHIMLNRVHPEHGVMLPSKNDQLKASKWAQAYSERLGTNLATPNRGLNNAARDGGEYVKADRRKTRNIYEHDKILRGASNDNDRISSLRAAQTKKDAALALRGRNLAALHKRGWETLSDTHNARKAALGRQLQKAINKAKAEARAEFRPARLDLEKHQKAERQTFEGLEESFFGRVSSVFKTARLSAQLIHDDKNGIITRSFKILTNAGMRKEYFDKAQQASRNALQRQEQNKGLEAAKNLKEAHMAKLTSVRASFMAERGQLAKQQDVESKILKADWKIRIAAREDAMKKFVANEALHQKPVKMSGAERRAKATLEGDAMASFDKARQSPSREQNNKRDEDRER